MIAIIWVLFIYQHADYASGIYGDTLNEFNIKYIIYQNGLLIIATIFSVISGANYIWRIHKTK
jgi:hypothetical protein